MTANIKTISVSEVWKLFNLGGTVLVEAQNGDDLDIMPASWSCPLDYDKLNVVIDSSHYTRKLVEKDGYFLLALPTAKIVQELMFLGTNSKNSVSSKIEDSKIEFYKVDDCRFPLPKGCVAWAVCKVLPETEIQKKYDFFLGQIVQAFYDERVIKDGHPQFENLDADFSILPNFGGAMFYRLGKRLPVPGYDD